MIINIIKVRKEMCREENIEAVLGKLKEKGCRITAQRRLLIRLILENEYSSCKEIWKVQKGISWKFWRSGRMS